MSTLTKVSGYTSSAAVTRFTQIWGDRGWMEQRGHPDDGRVTLWRLSAKGRHNVERWLSSGEETQD